MTWVFEGAHESEPTVYLEIDEQDGTLKLELDYLERRLTRAEAKAIALVLLAHAEGRPPPPSSG